MYFVMFIPTFLPRWSIVGSEEVAHPNSNRFHTYSASVWRLLHVPLGSSAQMHILLDKYYNPDKARKMLHW